MQIFGPSPYTQDVKAYNPKTVRQRASRSKSPVRTVRGAYSDRIRERIEAHPKWARYVDALIALYCLLSARSINHFHEGFVLKCVAIMLAKRKGYARRSENTARNLLRGLIECGCLFVHPDDSGVYFLGLYHEVVHAKELKRRTKLMDAARQEHAGLAGRARKHKDYVLLERIGSLAAPRSSSPVSEPENKNLYSSTTYEMPPSEVTSPAPSLSSTASEHPPKAVPIRESVPVAKQGLEASRDGEGVGEWIHYGPFVTPEKASEKEHRRRTRKCEGFARVGESLKQNDLAALSLRDTTGTLKSLVRPLTEQERLGTRPRKKTPHTAREAATRAGVAEESVGELGFIFEVMQHVGRDHSRAGAWRPPTSP